MKKYLLLFNVSIIFFSIFLDLPSSYCQLSESFNKALPDSLRPKSTNKLHYTDLTKIFVYALNTENLEDRFHQETKTLFLKYGAGYQKIKNKKNRLDFIIAAHNYARIAFEKKDIAAKYIFALKKELDNDSKGYEYYLAQYYFLNNWYLKYFKANKIEAYENLVKCLNVAKQIKDSILIRKSYYSLSYLYASLRLYQQSINYADSTYQIQRKLKTSNFKLVDMQYHTIKADVYHDFYLVTKNKVYIDSTKKYIRLVPFKNNDNVFKYLETACLVLKAWLIYHEGNYNYSIQLLDSLPKYGSIEFQKDVSVFTLQALNNLKTGKSKSELKSLTAISENDDHSFLELVYKEAAAFAKKNGNYSEALYYQERLLQFVSSQNNIKSEAVIFERELDNKLNARDLAISKLNEEKSKTYLWGSVLFFILLSIIFFYYFRAQHIKSKRDLLFQQINELTDNEVIKLQLAEEHAKDTERKKMGQELHDDLAGTLAALKIKMENEVKNTEDENSKKRLLQINKTINNAYQLTRNKSHRWFDANNNTFSDILNDILDKGLSDDNYTKEVTIDKDITLNFSSEIMVELIYITKEAITNILKHAKANKVDLLLYHEVENIIFQIKDNGKGYNSNKSKKGVGLQSIESRATKIGGRFEIKSTKNGTEITISIPQK